MVAPIITYRPKYTTNFDSLIATQPVSEGGSAVEGSVVEGVEPISDAKKSDEQVITRKDEQVIGRKDEQMARRKDEQVIRRKDEQMARRKDEQMISRKDEQMISRKDEQVTRRKEKGEGRSVW